MTPADSELAAFLARHPSFGGWRDTWSGVPLRFRACLADDLPPAQFVGSVRAVVLRGDHVLAVGTPPIFSVGGRQEPGETIEQTLLRETAEESGWIVRPIAVIGFIHTQHEDAQRPAWGRPAPDFIDPLFAAEAVTYEPSRRGNNETPGEFMPIADVEAMGVDPINLTFLREAIRKRG